MKRLMMLLVAGLIAVEAADRSASASTSDLGTLDPGTTSATTALGGAFGYRPRNAQV